MENHKFKYTGLEKGKKTYNIKCLKEGGSFNTSLWDSGKVTRNKCLCCGEEIKRK